MAILNPLLRMATIAGVEVAVRLHISRGDNLDARDGSGCTPLMLAAARKKKGVLRLLLDAGASPELIDAEGRSALAHALKGGCPECIAILESFPRPVALSQGEDGAVPLDLGLGPMLFSEATPPVTQSSNELDSRDLDPTVEKPKDFEILGELKPAGVLEVLSPSPVYFCGSSAPVHILELDDQPLESEFESFWEAESETEAPAGNESIALSVTELQVLIGLHKAIDTDESWDDIELFLPERSLPLVRDHDEGIRGMLFQGIREGGVPEGALIQLCLRPDGSRNEEFENLLHFVLSDLSVRIFEGEGLDDSSFLGTPTSDEEHLLAEVLEYTEDLASGKNDPLRHYVKSFKAKLLRADEEIALGKEMEEAGSLALDALSSWPYGLARIFEAAEKVISGEADYETFSSGRDASPDVEAKSDSTLLDDEFDEEELEPDAAAFVAAVSEARLAVGDQPKVRVALGSAGLLRGFLLELSKYSDADPISSLFSSAIRRQEAAREKMILANLRLAFSIARKYLWSDVPPDDLVQEGNIGLMKAVERFDWRKGFRFSTYATWWIRQQISRSIANTARAIRVPVHMQELARKTLKERAELEGRTGKVETEREISIRSGVPLEKLKLLLNTVAEITSLDDCLPNSDIPLVRVVPEMESSDPALAAEHASLRAILLEMISGLDQRSADVVMLRFGLGQEEAMTLEEIGSRFEVTRERIRQIESKALRKLSTPAKRDKLGPYIGDQFEVSQVDDSTPPQTSSTLPASKRANMDESDISSPEDAEVEPDDLPGAPSQEMSSERALLS